MSKIGNYKVGKQIGEGGFGRVFEAEHIILGEKACLKQNIFATEEHVEILRNEAKLLWRLHEYHSIPAVRDFFVIDNVTGVMAMSLIEGKTLESLVLDAEKNSKKIHPEDACWITERLLGALYYAHCNGVIHTDVKPENVFVEPQKRDIKLIDFGLALYKPNAGTTPKGFTPKYAAPELVLGKPPIPETDIYGVGVVLLRALGGDMINHSYSSGTPKELTDFCDKLLRYNATDRPNWKKDNPIIELSSIRERIFGRRHLSSDSDKKLKGGVK